MPRPPKPAPTMATSVSVGGDTRATVFANPAHGKPKLVLGPLWRGDRAAEGARLEIVWAGHTASRVRIPPSPLVSRSLAPGRSGGYGGGPASGPASPSCPRSRRAG